MSKHAALFDLDGVIIDTEGTYSQFWSEMGKAYGVPYPDFADRIKGTTLSQILNTYFPEDKHPELLRQLTDFEANMEYPLFPGAKEFIESLAVAGIPCAIVTSSGEKKMSRLWEQHPALRLMFQAVITDAQVERSKPDPQGYQLAAEALGMEPEQCVVFEDSFNGLLAGKRSGAKVVALSTTNPASELLGKADIVAPSISALTIDSMDSLF